MGALLVPVTLDIQTSGDFWTEPVQLLIFSIWSPKDSGLINPVWPGTKILGIDYNETEKTLIIDFSKEVAVYGGGTAEEDLTIPFYIQPLL